MTTRLACAYCGVTRWTLYRAIAAGELAPVAKRGRLQVFERAALDRWMLGGNAVATSDRILSVPTSDHQRTVRAPSTDVLARLRAIKAGGR